MSRRLLKANTLHLGTPRLASLPPSQFSLAQPRRYPLSSPDTTRSLIRDVGPCLQDILLYLTAPSRHEDLVNAAIPQYTSVEAIYRLLSGRDLSTNPDAQKLILISRAGPIAPKSGARLDPNTDDRPIARFKTHSIHARVLANVTALSTQDTQSLYATFRAAGGPGVGGGGGAFAAAASALLFENMALRYARTKDDRPFFRPRFPAFRHPFAHMDRQTPPSPSPLRPDRDRLGMAACGTARTTRAQAATPVRFLYRSDGTAGRRTTVTVAVPSESESEPELGEVAWRASRGVELVARRLSCLAGDSHEPWANFPYGTHAWPSVAALCGAVYTSCDSSSDDDDGDDDDDDVPWTTAVSRCHLDGAFFCPLTMLRPDSGSDGGRDRDSAPAAVFDAYALRDRTYKPAGEPHEIWAIRVATPGRRAQGGMLRRGTRPSASASTTTSTRDEGEGGFAAIARLQALLRAGSRWRTSGPELERPICVRYALLVPYDGAPEFGVEWSLPAAGFGAHPGEVYVQFLDVGAFGGDVAQVLGVPRPDRDACVDGAPAAGPAAKRGSKRRREGAA